MATATTDLSPEKTHLLRLFLKQIVNDDLRAKQLFRLYYDRGEISEEQFFEAIETYQR
ncbi:MAG: hypothetical protein R8G33_07760 [Gammaproteobacteria bacterium]|nr:hypothetical protein [Gammaproteobacteria bacterium]